MFVSVYTKIQLHSGVNFCIQKVKTIIPHCYVIDKWIWRRKKGKYLSVCVQWLNTQVVSIRGTLSSWWRQPVGARGKQAQQRNPGGGARRGQGGEQPPVVITPVTSFTSLNYNQQQPVSSLRLVSASRLIRAADDFLDVESCIDPEGEF